MDNNFDYTVKFEGVTDNKSMSVGETEALSYASEVIKSQVK